MKRADNSEGSTGRPPGLLERLVTPIGAVSISIAIGGVIALFIGLIIWVFFHEMRSFAYALMALGGVALLLSFLVSYQQAAPVLFGRRSRLGLGSVILSLLLIGIAMLVNYVVFTNNARVDITEARKFTLAQRTVQLLGELEDPIRATAFFRETDAAQQETASAVDDFLHEFERRSDNFSYRFVDPDTDPITAKEYAITRYQAVVFENMRTGKRQTIATPPVLEEQFVTALLITSGREQKRVYFLTGHGERDTLDTENEGYAYAYAGLISDNYLPLTLNLLDQQEVPDDAAAVIIAGPKKDLVEGEGSALEDYLLNGGRILFLLDPWTPAGIADLLRNWGIKVEDGQVIDLTSSVGGDPKIPLLQRNQFAADLPPLTDVLDVAFFPEVAALTTAVESDKMPSTISYTSVGVTSYDSWLISDPAQDRPVEGDPQGPFAVAAVVEAYAPLELPPEAQLTYKKATLVIIGDSDFAANRYYYAFSNSDLFLDSVNWLTEDYALISIRPKPVTFRELVLTTRERDFFRYSTWFLLPLTMLGLAGIVWWRRR